MTWYAITALIGVFIGVGGFILTQLTTSAGDDYIAEAAGYFLIIVAMIIEIVAGIGWIAA